jgi:hypothetical protein
MKGNIPQETTSFVGRSPELARLDAALSGCRLITLTGAGGVGKTRPARRAAAGTAGRPNGADDAGLIDSAGIAGTVRFPDGTWWADLSTPDNPHLLLATVSDAVDLADHSPRMPVEALCEWPADKRPLLVLDSCEHLASTWRAPAEPGAAEAAESICRRLEGIPPAIEPAAARVGPVAVTEAEQAASVYGTGEAYWRGVGHPQRGTPEPRAVRERCEATARTALGDSGYAAAYARGVAAGGPAALAAALLAEPPGVH